MPLASGASTGTTCLSRTSTILYRIKLYRGANDHAKTERTQAQARSSPGCKACCKCSSDSEGPAKKGRRSSRTRRGHNQTRDGAQQPGDTDRRAAVAAKRIPPSSTPPHFPLPTADNKLFCDSPKVGCA